MVACDGGCSGCMVQAVAQTMIITTQSFGSETNFLPVCRLNKDAMTLAIVAYAVGLVTGYACKCAFGARA